MATDTGEVEGISKQRLALLYTTDDRGQILRANEPWGAGMCCRSSLGVMRARGLTGE